MVQLSLKQRERIQAKRDAEEAADIGPSSIQGFRHLPIDFNL